MQGFYGNLKTKGEQGVTSDERKDRNSALVDYGHLQSPTTEEPPRQSSFSPSQPRVLEANSESPSTAGGQSQSPLPLPGTVPTATSPSILNGDVNGIASPATLQQALYLDPSTYQLVEMYDDSNPFQAQYEFGSADFDAIMADAAQGFWEDFPGQVGIM